MRALVYSDVETVSMREMPSPTPAPHETLVAIEHAGICGSDISGFLGHSPRRKPPLVLGHELVGRLPDGERVVANPLITCGHCNACLSGHQNLCSSWRLLGMDRTHGSYAEFAVLPRSQVFPIPDELPHERAILAEPLANIVHLLRLAAPAPFFRLAIVGAGTMGALLLQAAQRVGARDILVVDVNAERLEIMRRLGASSVLNIGSEAGKAEIQRYTAAGFDLVVDASGAAPARQLALDLCRPGGDVVLLGMGSLKSEVDFVTSIRKEHRIRMSFAYTPVDFQTSLDLLTRREIDLTPYTDRAALEEGQRAFEKMARAPGAVLKMMLSIHPGA